MAPMGRDHENERDEPGPSGVAADRLGGPVQREGVQGDGVHVTRATILPLLAWRGPADLASQRLAPSANSEFLLQNLERVRCNHGFSYLALLGLRTEYWPPWPATRSRALLQSALLIAISSALVLCGAAGLTPNLVP